MEEASRMLFKGQVREPSGLQERRNSDPFERDSAPFEQGKGGQSESGNSPHSSRNPESVPDSHDSDLEDTLESQVSLCCLSCFRRHRASNEKNCRPQKGRFRVSNY